MTFREERFSVSLTYDHITISASYSRIAFTAFSQASGSTQSSESTNMMYSPQAQSSASFRARDTPPFALSMTCIRASSSAYRRRISGLPSREPSLTQIISRFW